MSKSRGTFIKASTYAKHLNPEFLRYYLATKLSDQIEDLDINFDDFTQRINSDLIGKLINIASRCASFISKYFSGELAKTLSDPALYDIFSKASDTIADKYVNREFSQAMRQIFGLADRANQYIDEKKPWTLAKDPAQLSEVQAICTMGINLFRVLMIYLKPVLPETAKKVESFLNIDPLVWTDVKNPLINHTIHTFQPLAQRIDKNHIDAMKLAAIQEIETIHDKTTL
jgi:methionyl-tRNA synthetase